MGHATSRTRPSIVAFRSISPVASHRSALRRMRRRQDRDDPAACKQANTQESAHRFSSSYQLLSHVTGEVAPRTRLAAERAAPALVKKSFGVWVHLKHSKRVPLEIEKISLPASAGHSKFRHRHLAPVLLNRTRRSIKIRHFHGAHVRVRPASRRRRWSRPLQQSSPHVFRLNQPVLHW